MRMKQKKLQLIMAIFTFMLLQGCAFHEGMMTGSVQLSQGNFRMVKTANGKAQATYIFGLGGLDRHAMVHAARLDMYKKYPLGANQAYANISVDFRRAFFPFVWVTTAYVTADVVEFGAQMPVLGSIREERTFAFKHLDEIVYDQFGQLTYGVLVLSKNVVSIEKVDGGRIRFSSVNFSGATSPPLDDFYNLYLTSERIHITNSKFQIGDQLSSDFHGMDGRVIGINEKKLLIQTPSEIRAVHTSELLKEK